MPMYASDVKIAPDLSSAIGGIGKNAYGAINSNYDAAKQKMLQDANARGMAPGGPNSYGSQRMATSQGLDVGGLESAIGGGLGDTSYKDKLAQREFEQNKSLAEEAASLNKPGLLEQILGGIGQVGGPMAQAYGAWGGRKTQNVGGGGGNAYDIMNPGPLDLGYNWGGR